MKMWFWWYSITNFTTVLDKKKVGRKSPMEKLLPYQTFLREGIPAQWPNQFFVYSIFLFYVLVRTL
jgi:hypothetical protein